jgi:hypothetical protein
VKQSLVEDGIVGSAAGRFTGAKDERPGFFAIAPLVGYDCVWKVVVISFALKGASGGMAFSRESAKGKS